MLKRLEKSHKLLHSFCIRPDIHFNTQDDDENVILIVRSHPITQLPWIINGIIFGVILIIVDFVLFSTLTTAQLIMINFLAVIMLFGYMWFNFLAYYFNVGIITNKRIVDIDYHSVMYREVSETQFNKVEDVTSKSSGYIASLFNYGDIYIQTAGTNANLELVKVPKPVEVEDIINNLMEA